VAIGGGDRWSSCSLSRDCSDSGLLIRVIAAWQVVYSTEVLPFLSLGVALRYKDVLGSVLSFLEP
jgi:hypothetical protein